MHYNTSDTTVQGYDNNSFFLGSAMMRTAPCAIRKEWGLPMGISLLEAVNTSEA